MPTVSTDTDVLIVGAGPVGLFLACECARRGLRWRLVEQHATQSQHSKALAIFPRTLEIFDMAGLAGPFLAAANRVQTIRLAKPRRVLASMAFAPADTAYPFIAMVPQDVTERLLVEALRARGGAVEYQVTLVAAEPGAQSVQVTLEREGRRESLVAGIVVGCDGARSAVRHLLNLPFEGGEYHEHFMLADVDTNGAVPASEMLLCPNSAGPLALFPISATRSRIVAMTGQPEGEAPSLELTRRLLAERAPAGIEARSLHWSSYFHIHHRRVSRLREGRMFVAGDAAHIHSPFGGQGMNTGLQDAWNLVWKLDLWLRGHGKEALLDSYTAERVPVIKQVVDTTHLMTRVLGTPSRLVECLRALVIPLASRLAPFRRSMTRRLSGLGIAYRGSPIVAGDGERCMDASLGGGTGIASRFLLMLDAAADPATGAAAQALANANPEVLELRRTPRRGLALLRPDGYLAYSANGAGEAALARVRDVLALQVALAPAAVPQPVGAG